MTAAAMLPPSRPISTSALSPPASAMSPRGSFHGRVRPQAVHKATTASMSASVAGAIASMKPLQNLAGIENIVGIERALDRAHQIECDRVFVLRQDVALHDADAVLGRN